MQPTKETELAYSTPDWAAMERSRYTRSDVLGVRIARFYSNELNKPFYAAVGDHEGYDVASFDGEDRVEIKFETTPARTGNLAVEYFNSDLGKPSGILATKANRWLHIVPDGGRSVGYELDVDVLRKIVIESGRVESNGRNALCKIIPLSIIKLNAMRCIDLTLALVSEVSR